MLREVAEDLQRSIDDLEVHEFLMVPTWSPRRIRHTSGKVRALTFCCARLMVASRSRSCSEAGGSSGSLDSLLSARSKFRQPGVLVAAGWLARNEDGAEVEPRLDG